jgi:hypothetical protein
MMKLRARLDRIEAKLDLSPDIEAAWVYFLKEGEAGQWPEIYRGPGRRDVVSLFVAAEKGDPFGPGLMVILEKNESDRRYPKTEDDDPDVEPDPRAPRKAANDVPTGSLSAETQQWVHEELRPCLTAAQQRIVDAARYVVLITGQTPPPMEDSEDEPGA